MQLGMRRFTENACRLKTVKTNELVMRARRRYHVNKPAVELGSEDAVGYEWVPGKDTPSGSTLRHAVEYLRTLRCRT